MGNRWLRNHNVVRQIKAKLERRGSACVRGGTDSEPHYADAFTHGSAKLSSGVRLHHVTAGTEPATIVLLLGYPQTWCEWRHVIGPLAEAGFRVVAPGHRGAG